MSPDKSVDNYSGNPVARRKAEVRKQSRTLQIAGGVAVAGVILGFFESFFFLVAVIAVVVAGVSAWKIREIVNQQDQW